MASEFKTHNINHTLYKVEKTDEISKDKNTEKAKFETKAMKKRRKDEKEKKRKIKNETEDKGALFDTVS